MIRRGVLVAISLELYLQRQKEVLENTKRRCERNNFIQRVLQHTAIDAFCRDFLILQCSR
jgi:hypothetical protein